MPCVLLLSIFIFLGGAIKAMLINSIKGHSYSPWGKISGAFPAIGIIKKLTFRHRVHGISAHNPVGNLIMNFLWIHIPYILWIIFTPNGIPHTDKLSWLFYDTADIPALAHPREFPIGNRRPIANHRSYRSHPIVAFPSCLTLDQSSK